LQLRLCGIINSLTQRSTGTSMNAVKRAGFIGLDALHRECGSPMSGGPLAENVRSTACT
jgi:hypothetical protein